MNSGKQDSFKTSKYDVDLDLTEVLNNVLDARGRQKEVYTLHWLLLRLSGHQIELTKVLSQAFPELGKQMSRLFIKRIEDNRQALRWRKLIGFKSAGSIEDEAVRRAWEDTRAMLREVSMLQDDSIKGLIDDHRAILRRLCNSLVEIVQENQKGNIDIDFKGLGKFLEG